MTINELIAEPEKKRAERGGDVQVEVRRINGDFGFVTMVGAYYTHYFATDDPDKWVVYLDV